LIPISLLEAIYLNFPFKPLVDRGRLRFSALIEQ
jgi:hypothetical protein